MSSSLLPRGAQDPGTNASEGQLAQDSAEVHVRRLRAFVVEALRRDPRLRVVELTPDGRRLAVSVSGVGLVHLENPPAREPSHVSADAA